MAETIMCDVTEVFVVFESTSRPAQCKIARSKIARIRKSEGSQVARVDAIQKSIAI